MFPLEFLFGLSIGLTVVAWQHHRWRTRLKELINSFSSQSDRSITLPPMYLVRREIENLQLARREIAQERDNWQRLMDQAPIGYILVDEDNQLLWCNQQAQVLLKLDRWRWGEVRLLLELVRSYELDQLIERTRQSQQKQAQKWVFYHTRHASGKNNQAVEEADSTTVQAIALQAYSLPLPGRQIGVFLVNRQPLVNLSQSRDRAVSDLSHELKTPLTSISLVAENLLNRLHDPERRWVQQMSQEAKRLIELVQEWLDLTQLEAEPQRTLRYEAVNLAATIDSIWQTLEPIARKKQIQLELAGDKSLNVEGDKSRLIQVFLNLLDNAIKHSPEKGLITVKIETKLYKFDEYNHQNAAIIDILDLGTGFTESDLPHVFERLYRGETSRTRQGSLSGGSGLGLAIVRQIVRAHNGAIEAKNHPDLGGAWLKVCLPLTKAIK